LARKLKLFLIQFPAEVTFVLDPLAALANRPFVEMTAAQTSTQKSPATLWSETFAGNSKDAFLGTWLLQVTVLAEVLQASPSLAAQFHRRRQQHSSQDAAASAASAGVVQSLLRMLSFLSQCMGNFALLTTTHSGGGGVSSSSSSSSVDGRQYQHHVSREKAELACELAMQTVLVCCSHVLFGNDDDDDDDDVGGSSSVEEEEGIGSGGGGGGLAEHLLSRTSTSPEGFAAEDMIAVALDCLRVVHAPQTKKCAMALLGSLGVLLPLTVATSVPKLLLQDFAHQNKTTSLFGGSIKSTLAELRHLLRRLVTLNPKPETRNPKP
jgi:hypothetical protein